MAREVRNKAEAIFSFISFLAWRLLRRLSQQQQHATTSSADY
jgi:type II secretory pathway component PulJ